MAPSSQRPAPAVQPAVPAVQPAMPSVAPAPADPAPPVGQGKTGAQWWKGSAEPAPDPTVPERATSPDDGPRNEPQEARGRIRTNSVVFGVLMLVVGGVLLVRGVARARERRKGPKS